MIFSVEKIDHHQLFKIMTIEIFQTIKFFFIKNEILIKICDMRKSSRSYATIHRMVICGLMEEEKDMCICNCISNVSLT